MAMSSSLSSGRVRNQVRVGASDDRDNCMLTSLAELGLLMGGEGEQGGEVVRGLRQFPGSSWLNSQKNRDAAKKTSKKRHIARGGVA